MKTPTLTNAAREFIDATLARIRATPGQMNHAADLASALRERAAIEHEIEQLALLLDAARQIAKMQHPSIEHLLRHRGFSFEADRVVELVLAIEAIDGAQVQEDSACQP